MGHVRRLALEIVGHRVPHQPAPSGMRPEPLQVALTLADGRAVLQVECLLAAIQPRATTTHDASLSLTNRPAMPIVADSPPFQASKVYTPLGYDLSRVGTWDYRQLSALSALG